MTDLGTLEHSGKRSNLFKIYWKSNNRSYVTRLTIKIQLFVDGFLKYKATLKVGDPSYVGLSLISGVPD